MNCEACGEESDDTMHVGDAVLCRGCAVDLCAEDDRLENEVQSPAWGPA